MSGRDFQKKTWSVFLDKMYQLHLFCCFYLLLAVLVRHWEALYRTKTSFKWVSVTIRNLSQYISSQYLKYSPFILPAVGNPRTGKYAALAWRPIWYSAPDCPPRECHHPLCDPDWAQPSQGLLLLIGHVGAHWSGPVNYHHSQNVEHLLVCSQWDCFWGMLSSNVLHTSVYRLWNIHAYTHGFWSLHGHLPHTLTQHNSQRQNYLYYCWSTNFEKFCFGFSTHIPPSKAFILWT